MSKNTLGIDAIALAVPEGYLELADLAAARGVPPGKYIEGLGVERMMVARAQEDPVALAATAARRALARAGVDPATIGLCVVGTETAVDHSKPIAAYLHRLLGLPQQCRVFEAKHACFGGTAGLLAALDWIASGAARGQRALIICTDIARYALGSAGEPTQGAGAVALIVSEAPRLVALEHGVTGSYAQDVNDFWRPLYSKEAVVDGHHSVQCYLDALAGAYGAWRARSEADGLGAALARRCYHVPYGKMARKAHRHLYQLEGKSEAEADAAYAREVAPSLRLPSQVGNIYTGSLYLALASLLDGEARALEGERIGLFSYGSGCCAEFFAGRVVAGAGDMVDRLQLAEPLAGRRRYTFAEYEAIRSADDQVDRRPVSHEAEPASGAVAFLGVDNERRVYAGF
ncbi:MAG TPA: hydroxymethylglutaryl-CoA synthase [Kofleriaceae bacterium]|jgi:hydroxymethylglutaryl-CoA synthase|nr:hydroxymethylglutaryl-CoA synthase [Kofleriaceae bacterium]